MYDICCVVKVKYWVIISDLYSELEISWEFYKVVYNFIRVYVRVYCFYGKYY